MLTQVYLNNNLRLFPVILESREKAGSSAAWNFPEMYLPTLNEREIWILQTQDEGYRARLPTWH